MIGNRNFLALCGCLFLVGAIISAATPYQSVIAVDYLGFDNSTYSVLLVASAVISLVISIAIGLMSDWLPNRGVLLNIALFVGVGGFAAIALSGSRAVFTVAIIFILPIAGTVYQQMFAILRTFTSFYKLPDADHYISYGRTVFAVAWVLVPPLIGLMIWYGAPLLSVYLLSAAASVACLMVFNGGIGLRQEYLTHGGEAKGTQPSALTLFADPLVIWPLAAVSLVDGATRLHSTIYGLIIVSSVGGTAHDIGVFAGLVALIEIPCMIGWTLMLRWFSKIQIISFAGILYAFYLILLSRVHTIGEIYALAALNGASSAALLSITISYILQLISDRPGLASSLLSITKFVGWSFAALVFSIAANRLSYQQMGLIAAAFSVLGTLLLIMVATVGSRRRFQSGV